MILTVTEMRFAICRLAPDARVPDWAQHGALWSVTRSATELSLVVEEGRAPDDIQADRGWRSLHIDGPLDLGSIGVIASLSVPLAADQIAVFVLSTFDTDIVLVKDTELARAISALSATGFTIREG